MFVMFLREGEITSETTVIQQYSIRKCQGTSGKCDFRASMFTHYHRECNWLCTNLFCNLKAAREGLPQGGLLFGCINIPHRGSRLLALYPTPS